MENSSYNSAKAERLLGAKVWKSYCELRASQKTEIDAERSAAFARMASALKSQKPLRTLTVDTTEAASREELARRMEPERQFSHARNANTSAPPWFLSRPLDIPDCFFVNQSNFDFATPSPEISVRTPANIYKGIGTTEIEAYGNAEHGKLSLGLSGGNWLLNNGEPFFSTPMLIHSPPDSSFPYDQISTSGRVVYLGNIAHSQSGPPWQPGVDSLQVTTSVRCPVGADDVSLQQFQIRPGTANSPSSGLISLTAYLNLTISYITGGKIVQSLTSSRELIELSANSGPGSYGSAFNIMTYENVFVPSQNMSQVIEFSTKLTLGAVLPDQLLTEVEVELLGTRAGNNAPGAGYVGMSFQDHSPGTITPIYGVNNPWPCPFEIEGISACVGA